MFLNTHSFHSTQTKKQIRKPTNKHQSHRTTGERKKAHNGASEEGLAKEKTFNPSKIV